MFISVQVLANCVNNKKRLFDGQESNEKTTLYEIEILNEHGHIIDYYYTTNDRQADNVEQAKRACKVVNGSDYRIIRLR